MNKAEFLDILGRSLKGKIDDTEYESQMDYYRSYFENELNSGRSEQDILDELGDPRLIAKTIVTTYGFNDDSLGRSYINDTYNDNGARNNGSTGNGGTYKSGGFFSKLKKYAIISLVIIVVFVTIAAFFRLLFVLLPIIFIFILITILFAMFRR